MIRASNARSLIPRCGIRDDTDLRQQITNCGFQSAEAEILGIEHAARKIEAFGIAMPRMFLNLGPARVTKSEKLRNFVERFAGGIVHGSANNPVIAQRTNKGRHGMSATDDERNIRFNPRLAEKWREQMAFEMVDAEIRLSKTDRQAFRNRRTDHKRART